MARMISLRKRSKTFAKYYCNNSPNFHALPELIYSLNKSRNCALKKISKARFVNFYPDFETWTQLLH